MRGTNESMKKLGILLSIGVLVAIVLPFFIYSLIPKKTVEKRYALRDINTIEDLIKVGDISTTDQKLLSGMIRELEYLKTSLPDKFHRMDFFLKIQPILSQTKDQNTRLIYGVPFYYPVLPFKARLIDGKLFIIESVDERLKTGDEIISVNGKDTVTFVKYLESLVSADSAALLHKKMEEVFWQLPFIEREEKYRIEVKEKGKIEVSFIPKKTYIEKLRKIKGHEWDYKFQIQDETGILRFKTFNLYGQDIQNLEDDMKTAAASKLKHFIIDIRDCTGGNLNTPLKVLAHFTTKKVTLNRRYTIRLSRYCGYTGKGELKDKTREFSINPEDHYIPAKLIILVDRTTSNEALDFAYIVEKTKLGEIYGEVPDQNLGHTFMARGKSLPSVGMFISISCAKWNDDGKLTIKKRIVQKTSDYIDFLSGKEDMMLDTLLHSLTFH